MLCSKTKFFIVVRTCVLNNKVNAITINIPNEDHTLENVIKTHLATDPRVVFVGYRIPHPLTPLVIIKLRTQNENPKTVLDEVLTNISLKLTLCIQDMQAKK